MTDPASDTALPLTEAREFADRAAALARLGPDEATIPLALVSIALSLATLDRDRSEVLLLRDIAYERGAEDARAVPPPVAPHPGENHEFRTTCLRCGEPGYLFVAVHAPGETFTVNPAPVEDPR